MNFVDYWVDKLKDKIVFFDFDGVLGTYQANSKNVHMDELEYIYVHMDKKYSKPYKYTRAPKIFREIISRLDSSKVYILSVTATSFEQKNKSNFIHSNYPNVSDDNIIYVGRSSYKVKVIDNLYYDMKGLDKTDICLVEDTISVIKSVEESGYTCYHVSSFLE